MFLQWVSIKTEGYKFFQRDVDDPPTPPQEYRERPRLSGPSLSATVGNIIKKLKENQYFHRDVIKKPKVNQHIHPDSNEKQTETQHIQRDIGEELKENQYFHPCQCWPPTKKP